MSERTSPPPAVVVSGADETLSCCPGYNAPYLSVYSENAVDVFDVNNMEWIQTIPLKKVSGSSLAPPAGPDQDCFFIIPLKLIGSFKCDEVIINSSPPLPLRCDL